MHRSASRRALDYVDEKLRQCRRHFVAAPVDDNFKMIKPIIFGCIDKFNRFVAELVVDNDGIVRKS